MNLRCIERSGCGCGLHCCEVDLYFGGGACTVCGLDTEAQLCLKAKLHGQYFTIRTSPSQPYADPCCLITSTSWCFLSYVVNYDELYSNTYFLTGSCWCYGCRSESVDSSESQLSPYHFVSNYDVMIYAVLGLLLALVIFCVQCCSKQEFMAR